MKAEAKHGKVEVTFHGTVNRMSGMTTVTTISRDQALDLIEELARAYQMSGDMGEPVAVFLVETVTHQLRHIRLKKITNAALRKRAAELGEEPP